MEFIRFQLFCWGCNLPVGCVVEFYGRMRFPKMIKAVHIYNLSPPPHQCSSHAFTTSAMCCIPGCAFANNEALKKKKAESFACCSSHTEPENPCSVIWSCHVCQRSPILQSLHGSGIQITIKTKKTRVYNTTEACYSEKKIQKNKLV